MQDPRQKKLADLVINYSVELKPGEKILIEATDTPPEFVCELVRVARKAGGIPIVLLKDQSILKEILRLSSEEQMKLLGELEKNTMKKVQAYIAVRGSNNASELAGVPDEKMHLYQRYWMKPVHLDIRVPNTKWVVMRYPNDAMAQQSKMATDDFEEFFYRVCTLDYKKMDRSMDPLVKLMKKTDEVLIKGNGTDLRFSIKGIPAVKCSGKLNIPDGEVYTAPVRDSINGEIQFNTPTTYNGVTFSNIWLKFEEGKIVDERAGSNQSRLKKILDSDEGSRYIGEFSFGMNPHILSPMDDILFDEKIAGSIHLTPGSCYKDAWNGNTSQIHWDMVLIQQKEYGGGEIYFDGELIRKDGMFVLPELKPLNP
jgi:aminopeptidase